MAWVLWSWRQRRRPPKDRPQDHDREQAQRRVRQPHFRRRAKADVGEWRDGAAARQALQGHWRAAARPGGQHQQPRAGHQCGAHGRRHQPGRGCLPQDTRGRQAPAGDRGCCVPRQRGRGADAGVGHEQPHQHRGAAWLAPGGEACAGGPSGGLEGGVVGRPCQRHRQPLARHAPKLRIWLTEVHGGEVPPARIASAYVC
mmetsp:Transcript_36936/g.92893  ORF Transcript_36936/g.92893 Transcript_36936/m.92893 type:complete len:200 (+) Transcript_36936:479-1078(+)